jgi:hypothetical protein
VEGSEEEDHLLPNEEDNYNDDDENEDDDPKNGMPVDGERNGGSELVDRPVIPQPSQNVETNGAGKPLEKSASNLIRSHSISGDLHGVHGPDPVAADILRKEPEQETYVKLNVSPIGNSSVLTSPPFPPIYVLHTALNGHLSSLKECMVGFTQCSDELKEDSLLMPRVSGPA